LLPDARELLLDATPPHLDDIIKKHLENGEYEDAAQRLLEELGPDGFQNMVAASAGDTNIEKFDFRDGVVSLLPLLASGPVITTSFDRVLGGIEPAASMALCLEATETSKMRD